MRTLLELLALVALIFGVFGTLLVIHLWIGAAAKWLWLVTVRGGLVTSVSLILLLLFLVAAQLILGIHIFSSLGFLFGLIATPFAAIPLADWLAFRMVPADRRTGFSRRNFIFADKRRSQSEAYLAPPIDP